MSARTHAKTTLYILALSDTKKITFLYFMLPWNLYLDLQSQFMNISMHTKFSSAILSNNFRTSLESIMLGHENDAKIWILLFVVQCCTGWLGMMSNVVSHTDMLQGVVTHPAFQLAPEPSSYILLLYGKFCTSFAKCSLITFSSLKSLSVAASVKELKCFRIIQ